MDTFDDRDSDDIQTHPALWEPDPARRCDACWARAAWLVEIPRGRGRTSSRQEPARVRLCGMHAENVKRADDIAVFHHMRETQ